MEILTIISDYNSNKVLIFEFLIIKTIDIIKLFVLQPNSSVTFVFIYFFLKLVFSDMLYKFKFTYSLDKYF